MTNELTLLIISAVLMVLAVFWASAYISLRNKLITLKDTPPIKHHQEPAWKYQRRCAMKFQDQIEQYINNNGTEITLVVKKGKKRKEQDGNGK